MDLISRQAAIDTIMGQPPEPHYPSWYAEQIKELPPDDLISRQAAIDVEGIDEQIRCEMCENPMHTDRGCDGNCKYDEKLYERIMQILGERIKPLPSAQFEERKESLCKKVRALCEESKIEFFFVGGGESTWSVTNDKHIKKIVECHKAQLSQEGTTKDATSDTISRQAAIDAIVNTPSEVQNKNIPLVNQYDGATFRQIEILGIIEALPSAQPEQRWIPCSERLPEMGSTVLMQNTRGWMFVATYAVTPKRKYWVVLEHDYALDEAIAWMPLPEPYKAESEE